MVTDMREELSTRGIVRQTDVYTREAIEQLNDALDDAFAATSAEHRSYVGGDVLAALGLLDMVFSAPVRAAIDRLFPGGDAVLYHCHAYEVAGAQDRPHIRDRTLDGWHRDSETVAAYQQEVPVHVSMFTYLNDVGLDGGAFELVPLPPVRTPATGTPRVSVRGPAGTTFWWNRSYFHRASPNRSPRRRRVLKLSLQSERLPNERIAGSELGTAGEHAAAVADPWLHARFGGPPAPAEFTTAPSLEFSPLVADGEIALTRVQTLGYTFAEASRGALRRVRALSGAPR